MRTPNILTINHLFEVTDWKYLEKIDFYNGIGNDSMIRPTLKFHCGPSLR